MKKIGFISLCLVFFIIPFFSYVSSESAEQTEVGVWKEYWGVGEETDVDYNDVYYITNENGIIKMTCPERPQYDFKDISFDGQVFKVVLINNDNPEDPFLINYSLDMNEDGTELKGKADTSAGEEFTVIWEKIE